MIKNKKVIKIFISLIFLFIIVLSFVSSEDSNFGEKIETERYEISRSKIDRTLNEREIIFDSISIKNKGQNNLEVRASLSPSLSEVIKLDNVGVIVTPLNESEITFSILGKERGNIEGEVTLLGDINQEIKVNITISNYTRKEDFFIEIVPEEKRLTSKEKIKIKIKIKKIVAKESINTSIKYELINPISQEKIFLEEEEKLIEESYEIRKEYLLTEETKLDGFYYVLISANQSGRITEAKTQFEVYTPLLKKKFLGIPLYWILISLGTVGLGIFAFLIIRREIEKRKRYKVRLDTKAIPKKGDRTIWLGKVAETKIPAYLNLDDLTTHAVVAGATGGGKSIAAQVLVEEALLNKTAVIVFDPTAQWSGMLRKCDDKKMMSFYPNFGMKPGDAQAFPGNVRNIVNARQSVDIRKYMNPGQIQIFTMNRLDPSEIDTFVATVIASIFRTGPEEYPGLRLLLVFDEVHRLLPKFGGSGKGFLQIERACREFRKWGFGVLLVSQVLSDFVGEIKANINTEMQMRTRDESDLNRIKTKYGEEFLQSLIKASIGTGMFANPKYNRGQPYFISFRPILHNTRRLTDDILDKYNAYGETIDDLEYQIEQLEAEKIDTFDMKMELKLVKDKLMSGNFSVVDIYLEGLKPRIEKNWQNIGKKPKKRELLLVAQNEVDASIQAADKERQQWEQKNAAANAATGNAGAPAVQAADPKLKLVKPITFDNGIMVSSIKELIEVLPTMEEDVLKIHITDKKNDISDWLKNIGYPDLAKSVSELKDKAQIVSAINAFFDKKPEEKKEDSASDKKTESKKKDKKEKVVKKEVKKKAGKK